MSLLQINAMLMGNQYRYPANALYTKEQVDTLILTNSYIPIANSSELVNLVQSASQTMGKGTPWQGNYTTGLDKKYIVVTNFTIASNITNTLDNFAGIFDGNQLKLTYNYGNLFGTPDALAKYYNLNVYGNVTSNGYLGGIWYTFSAYAENCTFTGSILNGQGSLARLGGLAVTTSSSTILKNCSTNVNITSTINDSNGGLGGLVALGNGGTFENCHSSGIYNGFSNTGGLIGSISSGDLILNNCSSDAVITGTINTGGLIGFFNRNTNSFSTIGINEFTGSVDGESNLGGIIGGFEGISANDINVSKLHSTGNITGTGNYIGGLFGMSFLSTKEINISDSYCSGDVQGNDYVGGLGGRIGVTTIKDCYSTGAVSGNTNVGGLIGGNISTIIINSYWDTETSGQATSDGGTGKTTAEMQQGSIPDTNIYVDWDSLIWGSGSTSEYPILKTVTASNKYLATEIVNDELVDQYGNINIPIVSGLVTDGTAILDLAGFGTTYDKSYYIGNSEGKDENWDYPFIYFDTNNPTHWKIEELNYRMIEEQYIAGDGNLKKLYAKLLYSGGTLQGLEELYMYNTSVQDETAILSVIGTSGQTIKFNGINQYAHVLDNGALDIVEASSVFYYGGWVNIPESSSGNHTCIAKTDGSDVMTAGNYSTYLGGDVLYSFTMPANHYSQCKFGYIPTISGWHHLATKIDITNAKLWVYLDGVKGEGNTLDGGFSNISNIYPFILGGSTNSDGSGAINFAEIEMKDIRIYRKDVTANLTDWMNGDILNDEIAMWKCDELVSGELPDNAGGFNLTLENNPQIQQYYTGEILCGKEV